MPPDSACGALDFDDMAERFQAAMSAAALHGLADGLDVTTRSLRRLRIGWSSRAGAWAFPMSSAAGRVLGIRLRRPDGRKFSVKGGREGLFVPTDLNAGARLLVCEGPTDTAALLDLGFAAVGRPSCTGGVRLLVELTQERKTADVVIVADADGPGRKGSQNLASVLAAYSPTVRVIEPPVGINDARDWKRQGATRDDVLAVVEATPAMKLNISTQRSERVKSW